MCGHLMFCLSLAETSSEATDSNDWITLLQLLVATTPACRRLAKKLSGNAGIASTARDAFGTLLATTSKSGRRATAKLLATKDYYDLCEDKSYSIIEGRADGFNLVGIYWEAACNKIKVL